MNLVTVFVLLNQGSVNFQQKTSVLFSHLNLHTVQYLSGIEIPSVIVT